MKTFDTLYKRNKQGGIVYWQIKVEPGDAVCDPAILKESGQLGTSSPIKHTERVSIGKQKRSATEQADFQAESDWKKKRDEGYKSLEDLNITEKGTGGYIDGAGNDIQTLQLALDLRLPQFNTDSSGNVKPMLATDWKKIKSIEYPCFCEPKLDGVRCLMIIPEDLRQIKFLSRSGKEYTTLHQIEMEVKTALWGTALDFPVILDGEIYSDELNFQEIVSAVKAYKPNSDKLKFRVYDIVSEGTQMERRLQLVELTNNYLNVPSVQRIEWTTVGNADEVKMYHDSYVQAGYEGAILRLRQGKYAQGQRSRELLKVKEFDETEYDLIGFSKGKRDEDLIANCINIDGVTFNAKMVGTKEQKEAIFANSTGGVITIKHFGLTEDGLPRFPIGKAIRDYE